MRKLATWLVVALVGGAFAVGLLGGALFAGGGGSSRAKSGDKTTSSAPATTSPVTAGAASARARTSPSGKRTTAARAKVSPAPAHLPVATSPPAAKTHRHGPAAVFTPEANPLAVRTPATTSAPPTGIPAPGGRATAGAAATPTGATPEGGAEESPGELVEVDSSTRGAALSQTLKALQTDLASGGRDTTGVQLLLLGMCGELAHSSLSTEGAFSSCESH